MVINGGYAYITPLITAEVEMAKSCEMSLVKEQFFPQYFAFGLQNNSAYNELFSDGYGSTAFLFLHVNFDTITKHSLSVLILKGLFSFSESKRCALLVLWKSGRTCTGHKGSHVMHRSAGLSHWPTYKESFTPLPFACSLQPFLVSSKMSSGPLSTGSFRTKFPFPRMLSLNNPRVLHPDVWGKQPQYPN